MRSVASSIRDDDRNAMHDDYAQFENELLKHLNWEEMYALPAFEQIDPDLARRIRDDHAGFRRTLGEIGIEIDLHAIRADRFEKFADELEAHAHREEAMYAGIGASLSDEARSALLRRQSSFFDA